MLGLMITFFMIGQAVQSGGRLILSQSFYLLAAFFAAMLLVTVSRDEAPRPRSSSLGHVSQTCLSSPSSSSDNS